MLYQTLEPIELHHSGSKPKMYWLFQPKDILNTFDILIFTDGSKSKAGFRTRVFFETINHIKHSNTFLSFEICAILKAIHLLEMTNKNITIWVDSQAVFKAVNASKFL